MRNTIAIVVLVFSFIMLCESINDRYTIDHKRLYGILSVVFILLAIVVIKAVPIC